MNERPEDVLKEIKRSNVSKVQLAVTGIDGVMRGKILHVDRFLSASETGIGFGNMVFGWDRTDATSGNVDYTGKKSGFPDARVSIDLATFRRLPWDNNTPLFLGDFVDERERPLPICPRQILKQIIAQAEVNGLFPKVGLEFEWANFRETPATLAEKPGAGLNPLTPGMFGFSLARAGVERDYANSIVDSMQDFGVPLESFHTETGPGVYEAAIMADDALEAADRGVLFKAGVKEIASLHGFTASFMARWNESLPGSNGHIHQSLWNSHGQNLFYESGDPLRMSKLYRSYLAGQIRCLPDLLPLFAPTVNSYKRFLDGHLAPNRISWGRDSRSVCLRVIPAGERGTRLELRLGGADINPYLAVAGALAAGLYGIENNLTLDTPMVDGDVYAAHEARRLPRNLLEATERFHSSQVARELLGQQFVEHYAETRIAEWRAFQKSVTDWEIKRYLASV
jgi:glutamine synthetase